MAGCDKGQEDIESLHMTIQEAIHGLYKTEHPGGGSYRSCRCVPLKHRQVSHIVETQDTIPRCGKKT